MTWLVALISSLAGFLFGYDEGIIAGSIDLVKAHFILSHTDIAWLASALPFGALLSAAATGHLLISTSGKKIGRRHLLSISGTLFFSGAIGAALSYSVSLLIFSRLILGIAIGIGSVVTPLYLAETAPTKMRGAIVSIYQLALTIGILSAYIVNYLLIDLKAWRLMFASSAIPAVLLVIGMRFLPESPRWLLSANQRDAARRALKLLRGSASIEHEFEHINITLSHEPKEAHWLDLLTPSLLPVLLIGILLFTLQQLSGINVVIYFAPEIFKNLGFNSTTGQFLATIGIGLVNVIVTIIALRYIDLVGRRKMLLLGFIGAAISLGFLSLVSYLRLPGIAYFSMLCLALYIFAFAMSLGPIPHIMMSEIFPLHVRGAGMGLSSMSNWFFNTFVIFMFPIMQTHYSIEFIFSLFSLICLSGYFYTYYYLPETKHLSLETIEDHLMSGEPLRKLGRTEQPEPLDESISI